MRCRLPCLSSALLVGAALVVGCSSLDAVQEPRYVDDNVLVSAHEPALALALDPSFTFLGRHPIAIDDIAAGERFVFVDAQEKRIERLFVVQFEGFLPGIDNFYRYDLSESPVVAGYPFRSNGYAFDLSDAVEAAPTRESASTLRFLQGKGYTPPDLWMMWRSLTVADAAKRSEMILFYVEDLASHQLTLADLYQDESATQQWVSIQQDLEDRANRSFKLAALDAGGRPMVSTWSRIPNRFVP